MVIGVVDRKGFMIIIKNDGFVRRSERSQLMSADCCKLSATLYVLVTNRRATSHIASQFSFSVI